MRSKILNQYRTELGRKVWRQSKAVCMCATLYKGGGNNSVTYIMELYEN